MHLRKTFRAFMLTILTSIAACGSARVVTPSQDAALSGSNGDAGIQCSDDNECTEDVYYDGRCYHYDLTDLTACGDGGHCNGNLHPAQRCHGCLSSGVCVDVCPVDNSCYEGVCH